MMKMKFGFVVVLVVGKLPMTAAVPAAPSSKLWLGFIVEVFAASTICGEIFSRHLFNLYLHIRGFDDLLGEIRGPL
jgi:hypothetical protein